jgi:hypothetical protein
MEIDVEKPKWRTQADVFNQRGEVLGVEGSQAVIGDASYLPFSEMKRAIVGRVAACRNGPAEDDTPLVLIEVL